MEPWTNSLGSRTGVSALATSLLSLDFAPHLGTFVAGGPMPHLSPPTLTQSETKAILHSTAGQPRDHLIYSLALGTGLRLAEIVGLNVGDMFAPDGTPRSRVRIRPEIAKGGRGGDVFLPDALMPKLRKFWAYKRARCEGLDPGDPLFCSQSNVRISNSRGLRADLRGISPASRAA